MIKKSLINFLNKVNKFNYKKMIPLNKMQRVSNNHNIKNEIK